MTIRRFVLAMACVALAAYGGDAEAQVARATSRAAKSALTTRARALLQRDAVRDALTRARALAAPKRVFRYTTAHSATRASKIGLPAGTHMTSRAGAGRPPSSTTAALRYGLPRKPTVRMLIELPKKTLIRVNKALGGSRGVGELTSTKDVPASAIKRILRLRRKGA